MYRERERDVCIMYIYIYICFWFDPWPLPGGTSQGATKQ